MSMYYSPALVRLLMEERLREARETNRIHRCAAIVDENPKSFPRGFARRPFRRRSPAAGGC
jgi:hypothetical protein